MPSNDRLTEFAAVASARSISAAARVLGMERATLSRRLTGLESELGVRLLHRSSRRLVLTPAGEELSKRARRIAGDAVEAWSAVRRMDEVPRGLLRVATVGDVLDELLIDYPREFPEVQVEIVDALRPGGLIAEGVDVAVRIGPVTDLDLIARRVDAAIDRLVVASAAYVERHGVPQSLDDLANHRCIVCLGGTWPLRAGGNLPIAGCLRTNELRLMQAGATRGLGLSFLPAPYIRDELESGALVPILPDLIGDTAQVSIVFVDREYTEPKVREFIDRAVPLLEAAFRRSPAAAG